MPYKNKEDEVKYLNRPDVKKRRQEYGKKYLKEYYKNPENRKNKSENSKKYNKLPEIKKRKQKYDKKYSTTPETREARRKYYKEYHKKPDVIERTRKRGVERVKEKLEKLAGRERPEICEGCGDKGRICYDHDHKTGEFRGWICHKCNLILGLSNDNPKILKSLIKYLNKNGISS